jgi:hypothetical protein
MGPRKQKKFTPNRTHSYQWGQVKTEKRNGRLANAENPAVQRFLAKKFLKRVWACCIKQCYTRVKMKHFYPFFIKKINPGA